MSDKPVTEKTPPATPPVAPVRPEDVPDDQLESVAAGHGHERYYHHHEGHRGYYRNGAFINLSL